MKTKIFSAFCLIASMFSCSKDCDIPENESQDNLVSPRITAMVNDETGYSPLTGILEVYPCESNSSIYYGNYVNGELGPFNGYYRILEGHIFGDYNRVLSLPDNFYNFVYWGTPKYEEPIYSKPQISSPGLVVGADLSKLYFTLRENDDKTCAPVYDLVFAQKETHTSDDFKAELKRAVAGLKVTVKNSSNGTFSSNIKSMEIHVGSIAEKLNFYTAQPENQTKTVKFELARSVDDTEMTNATVMLFPSAPNPLIKLVITMQDGTTKVLSKNIENTLSANTKLNLNITIKETIINNNTGDFSIQNWNEVSEDIIFELK